MSVKFCFMLEYPTCCGSGWFFVEPEQYEKFKDNPIDLVALHFGVTVDEYLRWVEAGGTVQCMGKTIKGRQCRCYVPGKITLDLNEWVDAIKVGGYCSRHGGEQ